MECGLVSPARIGHGVPRISAGDSVAKADTFNPKSERSFFLPSRCIFSAVVTIVPRSVDGMLERRAVGVRVDGIGC
jgi:hypothetical protein